MCLPLLLVHFAPALVPQGARHCLSLGTEEPHSNQEAHMSFRQLVDLFHLVFFDLHDSDVDGRYKESMVNNSGLCSLGFVDSVSLDLVLADLDRLHLVLTDLDLLGLALVEFVLLDLFQVLVFVDLVFVDLHFLDDLDLFDLAVADLHGLQDCDLRFEIDLGVIDPVAYGFGALGPLTLIELFAFDFDLHCVGGGMNDLDLFGLAAYELMRLI